MLIKAYPTIPLSGQSNLVRRYWLLNGQFLSDTFFKSFSSTVNMFISIFTIQILHNITNSWIFSDIGRNCLLGNRKKKNKFLKRTFTCRSTFLYGNSQLVPLLSTVLYSRDHLLENILFVFALLLKRPPISAGSVQRKQTMQPACWSSKITLSLLR